MRGSKRADLLEPTDGRSRSLCHQAVLHESPHDLLATLEPIVLEGLDRGATIVTAAGPGTTQAMNEGLGEVAGRIDLLRAAKWRGHPYSHLRALERLASELPEGGSLVAISEPVLSGSPASVRHWARYESIVNRALATAPLQLVCLYDSATLPPAVLAHAAATHPELVERGTTRPSAGYVPAEEFDPGPPCDPPPSAVELPLEGSAFRGELCARARQAGMHPGRVADFVLAANEIAANAMRHGRRPIEALIWDEHGEMVCRIADAGDGIADPLAGWMPPAADSRHGWGLPIARQLCDVVEIASDGEGAVVSLHCSLEPDWGGAKYSPVGRAGGGW